MRPRRCASTCGAPTDLIGLLLECRFVTNIVSNENSAYRKYVALDEFLTEHPLRENLKTIQRNGKEVKAHVQTLRPTLSTVGVAPYASIRLVFGVRNRQIVAIVTRPGTPGVLQRESRRRVLRLRPAPVLGPST